MSKSLTTCKEIARNFRNAIAEYYVVQICAILKVSAIIVIPHIVQRRRNVDALQRRTAVESRTRPNSRISGTTKV